MGMTTCQHLFSIQLQPLWLTFLLYPFLIPFTTLMVQIIPRWLTKAKGTRLPDANDINAVELQQQTPPQQRTSTTISSSDDGKSRTLDPLPPAPPAPSAPSAPPQQQQQQQEEAPPYNPDALPLPLPATNNSLEPPPAYNPNALALPVPLTAPTAATATNMSPSLSASVQLSACRVCGGHGVGVVQSDGMCAHCSGQQVKVRIFPSIPRPMAWILTRRTTSSVPEKDFNEKHHLGMPDYHDELYPGLLPFKFCDEADELSPREFEMLKKTFIFRLSCALFYQNSYVFWVYYFAAFAKFGYLVYTVVRPSDPYIAALDLWNRYEYLYLAHVNGLYTSVVVNIGTWNARNTYSRRVKFALYFFALVTVFPAIITHIGPMFVVYIWLFYMLKIVGTFLPALLSHMFLHVWYRLSIADWQILLFLLQDLSEVICRRIVGKLLGWHCFDHSMHYKDTDAVLTLYERMLLSIARHAVKVITATLLLQLFFNYGVILYAGGHTYFGVLSFEFSLRNTYCYFHDIYSSFFGFITKV